MTKKSPWEVSQDQALPLDQAPPEPNDEGELIYDKGELVCELALRDLDSFIKRLFLKLRATGADGLTFVAIVIIIVNEMIHRLANSLSGPLDEYKDQKIRVTTLKEGLVMMRDQLDLTIKNLEDRGY